jgi:hypothetical protein
MHLVMVVMMAGGSYIVTSMHVVLDGGVERKTAHTDAMRTVIALLWPKCSESSDLSRRDFVFFFYFPLSSLEGLIGVKRSTPTPSLQAKPAG